MKIINVTKHLTEKQMSDIKALKVMATKHKKLGTLSLFQKRVNQQDDGIVKRTIKIFIDSLFKNNTLSYRPKARVIFNAYSSNSSVMNIRKNRSF